jgi:hypothetical protein
MSSINKFQIEHFKNLSYEYWKEILKSVSFVSIGIDLTLKIVKNVKINSQFGTIHKQIKNQFIRKS